MPLLRFDVIEGRDEKSLQLLLDTAHQAMVEAFGVPERDRYQIVRPASCKRAYDPGYRIRIAKKQRSGHYQYDKQSKNREPKGKIVCSAC